MFELESNITVSDIFKEEGMYFFHLSQEERGMKTYHPIKVDTNICKIVVKNKDNSLSRFLNDLISQLKKCYTSLFLEWRYEKIIF